MKIKRVKCKSGLEGWETHLQNNYTSFEEFKVYSDTYALAERLGYKSPENAWKANPMLQGSVIPSDLRKVPKLSYGKYLTK